MRFDRAQHRDLLALLLLHEGRMRSDEGIIEDLWAGASPETATAQLRNMISALRARLSGIGSDTSVERERGGYRLRAPQGSVDIATFDSLQRRASAAGDPAERVALLREALELWRGEPLGNVRRPSPPPPGTGCGSSTTPPWRCCSTPNCSAAGTPRSRPNCRRRCGPTRCGSGCWPS